MSTQPFALPFPIQGINKRHAYASQAPLTTPSALNIWPTDWTSGRESGGTRPGKKSVDSSLGAPHSWAECNFVATQGGTTKTFRGVSVTTANGTYTSTFPNNAGGTTISFVEKVTANPASSFSSAATYRHRLFQASTGGEHINTVYLGDTDLPFTNDITGLSDPVANGTLKSLVEAALTADGTLPYVVESVPEFCGLIAVHGDRLVVAGDKNRANIVYFSRVGNYLDWNYASIDSGAAFASSGGTSGQVSEPVTSLISHNRDCLLIGCTDSLYVLRGNPKLGGQIYVLAHTIGPLNQKCWCKSGNDYTFFLTKEGLWSMPPGCGTPPTSVSREVLPDELIGLNPGAGDDACIGYDARFRGIHIYAKRGSTRIQYFYDLQSGGFWQMDLGVDIGLAVNHKTFISNNESSLLPISSTGSDVWQFDRTNTAESYAAHLYYGPIPIGGSPHTEGVLTAINAVTAYGSDEVKFTLYGGDSAQEAFNNPRYTIEGNDWDRLTTSAPKGAMNYQQHPRLRAATAYLKAYQDSSSNRWSIEEVYGEAAPSAMRRADGGA